MVKRIIIATFVLGLGLLSSVQSAAAATVDPIDVICHVNALREQAGLSPLKLNNKLTSAAQMHSDDMASTGSFSYIGSDNSSPGDRVDAVGYAWLEIGENDAYGYSDWQETFRAWEESPGHLENILNPETVHMGMAVATNSRGVPYWTAVFARPEGTEEGVTPTCDTDQPPDSDITVEING